MRLKNPVELNAIRVLEVRTILGFCYLTYSAREFPGFTDVDTVIRLSPTIPFVLAFVWSIRGPSASQWIAIRVIHQALALVILAIATILLVGLAASTFSELSGAAVAIMCIVGAGAVQLLALGIIRRIAPELPKVSRWHRVLRVSMVFLFAFVFILLK